MNFEELMLQGQRMHMGGEYEQAYRVRLQAFLDAPESVTKGRAARDVSASMDRMGIAEEAEIWAGIAYDLHHKAVEDGVAHALRERAASGMYVGSVALRQAVSAELNGAPNAEEINKTLLYSRGALSDITEYEQIGWIDQYRINMTGRVAMAEGLYGSRAQAAKLGVKAVGLGLLSESMQTANYNLAMPKRDRWHARFNAAARGLASLAATALSRGPLRRVGLKIVQKTL